MNSNFHFMAVSIWIGGLFYISTTLLTAIRTNATITSKTDSIALTPKITKTMSDKKRRTGISTTYYLALLLPI